MRPLATLHPEWLTWAAEDDVEVHTVDTNAGVVLDTQINVFLDTETEVTGLAEVSSPQFVLTDLQEVSIVKSSSKNSTY